jgi:hypothetical protein
VNDFSKMLSKAVEDRLRFIGSNEERLVEAWVAQHGWKPDECQIVRQDMQDGTVRMWVEKRGDFDELQRFREREHLVQAALQDAKGYSQFEDLHELVTKALDFDLRSQCVAENSDTGDDPSVGSLE